MAFETVSSTGTVAPRPTNTPVTDEGAFDIRTQRPDPNTTVITVSGPLDMATLPHFDEIVRMRMRSTCPSLVLDLTRVDFLSAGAIEVLLHAQNRARMQEKQLTLITGAHAVDRPLRALGLTERFSYTDSPVGSSDPSSSDIAAVDHRGGSSELLHQGG